MPWLRRVLGGQRDLDAPSTREDALDVGFALACVALLSLCAWLALRWAPPLGFYSPDSALKWLQLKGLRFASGSLHTALRYPGRSFDPQLHSVPFGDSFYSLRNGEIQLVWPPWFALLSWPFEHWLGARGLRVLPALGACASGVLSALLAETVSGRRARQPGFACAALGSPLLVYGMLAWEHALAAALACLGVWLWLGAQRAHAPQLRGAPTALAGAALALACAMRAELWLLAVALLGAGVCAGRPERRASLALGVWLAGASVPFTAWSVLHTASALPTNAVQNYSRASFGYLRETGAGVLPQFSWGDTDALAWLGVLAGLLLMASAAVSGRSAALARAHAALLALYLLLAAALVGRRLGEGGDTLHGALESAPWLLFAWLHAPPTPLADARRARAARLLRLSLGAYVVLYLGASSLLSWTGPDGGREWGPRFVLPLFPLAAPLAVQALMPGPGVLRAGRYVALACGALALGMQLSGLRLVQRAEKAQDALARQLLAMPPGVVFVAFEWWLPTVLAPQFERRATFYLRDPKYWNELVARAACAQQTEIWIAGLTLPAPELIRAFTIPQLELTQGAQVELSTIQLRSLSARPRTPELCSYLAEHPTL